MQDTVLPIARTCLVWGPVGVRQEEACAGVAGNGSQDCAATQSPKVQRQLHDRFESARAAIAQDQGWQSCPLVACTPAVLHCRVEHRCPCMAAQRQSDITTQPVP